MNIIKIPRDCKKLLTLFVVYFTMFVGFLTFNLGVSESILYLCDILVFFLFFVSSKKIVRIINKSFVYSLFIPLVFLLVLGLTIAFFNDGSMLRCVWSLRNWGRLFIFYLEVLSVLKKKDCENVFNFVINVFHINFIIVIVQFLFFRSQITQDALNGLFGRNTSSVHLTMTLIVVAVVTSKYLSKQINFFKFLITMIEAFVVGFVAELRVVPVVVILILAIAYFSSSQLSIKSIAQVLIFLFLVFILLVFCSYMMKRLYPNTALNYTVSGIIKSATTPGGYGNSGGIDRLTFISVINEYVFKKGREWLFGIGVGNAEYSKFSIFCSPFYLEYGSKLSYLNFSSSVIYLETGIIGLILYSSAFIVSFIFFFRRLRKKIRARKAKKTYTYEVFGILMAFLNIFYIIYNNLQRTDCAYLLGFFLAVAYIGVNDGVKDVR